MPYKVYRRYKKDRNHPEIVDALEKIGVETFDLADYNFPIDLLCFYRGQCYWVEVKDHKQPPSKQKVKPEGLEFIEMLTRHSQKSHVVNSVDQALAVFNSH
jgi:hypothetical protein